jgi:hypothetical protein
MYSLCVSISDIMFLSILKMVCSSHLPLKHLTECNQFQDEWHQALCDGLNYVVQNLV